MKKTALKKYADLIVRKGINVQKGQEVVVYAGESKAQKDKEVIVAEIYPDFDALKNRGIDDVAKYFAEEMKAVNARMVSYKAVGKIKIRNEEFEKNTSRKIVRFKIDKTIE